MARPSKYTQQMADTLCARIIEGKSLRAICKANGIPSVTTVMRWLADEKHSAFREQYARAREAQADSLVEEILEIADDGTNDWMEANADGENIGWRVNGEHIQRSRLRVEARKWFASKVAPKKYGERITQEHTGPDGGPISVVERRIVGPNAGS